MAAVTQRVQKSLGMHRSPVQWEPEYLRSMTVRRILSAGQKRVIPAMSVPCHVYGTGSFSLITGFSSVIIMAWADGGKVWPDLTFFSGGRCVSDIF